VINLDDLSRSVLANNVISPTVSLHPNQNLVYYFTQSPERDFLFTYINLDTFESGILQSLEVPGIVSGWSDDGEWIAITYPGATGLTVINADGSIARDLVQVTYSGGPTMSPDVAWLNDNTLLYIQPNDPTQVLQYDPHLDETIAFDAADDINDLIDFDQLIMADDLSLVNFDGFGRTASPSPTERVYIEWTRAVWELNIPICSTYQIARYNPSAFELGQVEVIYENNVTYLDQIQIVGDGTLVFLEWEFENCSVSNDLVTNLVRLDPEQGTHEVITSDVVPSTSSFSSAPLLASPVLTVDTENGILYWLAGGLSDTNVALTSYDVDSGDMTTLITDISSSPGTRFVSLFWLANTVTVPEDWMQNETNLES
jgi:hypothetical protein